VKRQARSAPTHRPRARRAAGGGGLDDQERLGNQGVRERIAQARASKNAAAKHPPAEGGPSPDLQQISGALFRGGGGGAPEKSWWQESVSDPLWAVDRWLENALGGVGGSPNGGPTQEGEDRKRGGLVLYMEGGGQIGPDVEGSSDCGSLDITDIMTAFGAMSKSIGVPKAVLWARDPDGWIEAAKSWPELFTKIILEIPEAANLAIEDLRRYGMPSFALAAFEQVRDANQRSGAHKAGGTEVAPVKTDQVSSPAEAPDAEATFQGQLVPVPGWAFVAGSESGLQSVRDWQLPVQEWEQKRALPGNGGTVALLKQKYADGSERVYVRRGGSWQSLASMGLTGQEGGEWSATKTRPRNPNGSWGGVGDQWMNLRTAP
jgi:hypothetical protein